MYIHISLCGCMRVCVCNRLGYKFSRGFCVLFCRRTPLATTCTWRQHLYNIHIYIYTHTCACECAQFIHLCMWEGIRKEMIFFPTKLKTPSHSLSLVHRPHRSREGFYRTSINYVVYARRPDRGKVNFRPPFAAG